MKRLFETKFLENTSKGSDEALREVPYRFIIDKRTRGRTKLSEEVTQNKPRATFVIAFLTE